MFYAARLRVFIARNRCRTGERNKSVAIITSGVTAAERTSLWK